MADSEKIHRLELVLGDVKEAIQALKGDKVDAQAQLLRSTKKLYLQAEEPYEQVLRFRYQPLDNICMIMAIEMGVLDAVVSKGKTPVSASALSKEIGYNELLIVRMMRLLTSIGVCDEAGFQEYSSNATAEVLNTPGSKGGVKISNELVLNIGAKIVPYLRETGLHQCSNKAGRPNPFENAFGMSLFQLLKHDPELKKRFDDYMTGRKAVVKAPWFDVFPAARRLPAVAGGSGAATIVDVGGGQGIEMVRFCRRYPDFKGKLIIQDLPETLAGLQKNEFRQIEYMPHDFFTEEPIKGASAYYLHYICHDWADEDCQKILGNIAAAMDSKSRILIDDLVLADTEVDTISASLDVLMMMLTGGVERSEAHWRKLITSVTPALEIERIWSQRSDRESIIEVKRVQR